MLLILTFLLPKHQLALKLLSLMNFFFVEQQQISFSRFRDLKLNLNYDTVLPFKKIF
jgi:hypothetical protein